MKQTFNITRETVNNPEEEILNIRLGERHFGYAVSNPDATSLHQLAWYTDEDIDEQMLDDLYRDIAALRNNYQAVNICYDHSRSLLAPISKFQGHGQKDLLESMYGIGGKEQILIDNLGDWQMDNVYAVPEKIHSWMKQHFGKGSYFHCYSLGLRKLPPTEGEGSLIADFRTEDFSLLVSRDNKLLLAQTFTYSNPADVIYYLLKTCEEFGLSQETVQLSLSGLIARESVLSREIHQYFINVVYRIPSWKTPDAGENDYPGHFFTSLNDLATCV